MTRSGDGPAMWSHETMTGVRTLTLLVTAWIAGSLPVGLVCGRLLGARVVELD